MLGRTIIVATLSALIEVPGSTQPMEHDPGEKLGEVHFATSCSEPAQRDFNRAVALLHSFQFNRAIDGFDGVLRQDPT